MSYNFKKGDIVVPKSGFRPAELISDPNSALYGWVKLKSLHNNINREVHKSNLLDNYTLYSSKETTMATPVQTLYSFPKADGTLGYGIHIGTNSANKFLIEEKGTGTIHIFDKKDLEEVLPYTFAIRYPGNSTNYHFIGEPDTVKVGDILLQTDEIRHQTVTVVEIDTKSKRATKRFTGVKLLTQPL